MEVQVAVPSRCTLGEGPLWNPLDRHLYWTDIDRGLLLRYDPGTGEHEEMSAGSPVGGFTLQADGTLLLFMKDGMIRLWRDGHLDRVITEVAEERGTRFNDVIADPLGRVFCGTMPGAGGGSRLYRLDPDGTVSLVFEGLGMANGMGFTPDGSGLYLTDSGAREIHRYDYDASTGTLGRRRLFARVPEKEGTPDGLTVDEEGHVWSARWGGGCIVCYDPDGSEKRRIEIPTANVTSLTFGGPDYQDLYVTTAGGNEPSSGPHAGALFRLRPGVTGRREHLSRILPSGASRSS